jgi:hypothetical protein
MQRLKSWFLSKFSKPKPTPAKPVRRVNVFVEGSPWNRDAAALLKQFLETGAGKTFIAQLGYRRPNFSGASEPNAVALQAKFVAGFEACLAQIMILTEPPAEEERPVNNYPDIDDDSQWPKPNPEQKE